MDRSGELPHVPAITASDISSAPVTPEDLMPSDLSYVLYPGDIVTVAIFELYEAGRWFNTTRQLDAGGYYRVPELGER